MLENLGISLLIASKDASSTAGMAGAAIAQEPEIGFCEAGGSCKSCAVV